MPEDTKEKEELLAEIEQLRRRLEEGTLSEKALMESEERYKGLAEATFEGIVIHDGDTIVDANDRIQAMSGYSKEELKERSFFSLLEPESREVVRENLRKGSEGPYEVFAVAKDGSRLVLEVHGKEIPYKGTVMRVASVRDMTERMAAEEAKRRSESRYRLLAENVEDIIFTLGSDLTFNYVSPSFIRMTGFSIDELIEMGWQGLFAPDALERIMDAITDDAFGIMEDGKGPRESSIMVEAELTKKDGTTYWVEVNVSPILDEGGDVKEILGVARDISERKATQERFIEEKKRAELYLDLFGHDIRNINQGIMSYLELMLMRPGLEPDEADYIKSVLEQATRINDLVAKVQRLTQLRARRIEVENVDAEPLIQAAIDYVLAKYPYRDIRLHTSCTLDDHVVKGTRLLTDVFTSILDNSVRFNRRETVEVDIYCRRSDETGWIQFVFEDRGPGISDETKNKVFHRLEQPEGGIKGSGLGLTVVWEIMRQLGGRVWVEDRVHGDPGQGSRFVVELPFADR